MITDKIISLLGVFVVYMLSIVGFGLVYWRAFLRNRSLFSIGSEIAAGQAMHFHNQSEARMRALRLGSDLIRTALEEGEATGYPPLTTVGRWYEPSWRAEAKFPSHLFSVARQVMGSPSAGPQGFLYYLRIQEPSGRSYAQTLLDKIEFENRDLPGILNWWLRNLDEERHTLARRIATLNTQQPDVWTFSDFLYFSLITQTTVGYGDILPNSTTIRRIVSLQVLVGYALLVVVLNIVVSG